MSSVPDEREPVRTSQVEANSIQVTDDADAAKSHVTVSLTFRALAKAIALVFGTIIVVSGILTLTVTQFSWDNDKILIFFGSFIFFTLHYT